LLLSFVFLIEACNSNYTTRKKGYFKIDLPAHKYQPFHQQDFPYSFEYPVYAQIVKDSTYFDSTPENDYWLNVDFPTMHARLFLSYKIVGGKAPYKIKQVDGSYKDSIGINRFDLMVNDAFNLTSKNDVIASAISDSLMHTPNGLTGIFFSVAGNAATANQFFLSDTTRNFIRGALYFDATPNADSLRPVQEFLSYDLKHLINTFSWQQ
jgi:gliding motility-associated lipoprotein GldD